MDNVKDWYDSRQLLRNGRPGAETPLLQAAYDFETISRKATAFRIKWGQREPANS